MTGSLGNALSVQCRVIYALMMREVHTIYGRTTLGYLWVVIQTVFNIAVFWIMRVIVHAPSPHGLSVLSFLAAGFGIWYTIENSLMKCLSAVEANKALLTFPQVMPLDIMIARCLIVSCTQVVSMAVIIACGILCGYPFVIGNLGLLLFAILAASTLGLGLGTLFSAISSYFPTLLNIIPIIFRFLFFASGVFFSVTTFSGRIGDWLLWNPILQLIEITRLSVSNGYPADFVSVSYVAQFILYTLTLGLLLERHVRRRQQE